MSAPLTTIGNQLTPGRPTQITFGPNTALPNALFGLIILGHMGASGTAASGSYSAGQAYTPYNVNAVAGPTGTTNTEVAPLFGPNSELVNMILAAVQANSGGGTFPSIVAVGLNSFDTAWGTNNAAFAPLNRITDKNFIISPYDALSANNAGGVAQAVQMSGAAVTDNQQFGSFFSACTRGAIATLVTPVDNFNFIGLYLRDTGAGPLAPVYTLGMQTAAACAVMAANAVPFSGLDGVSSGNIPAPAQMSDWLIIGAGQESETVLSKGWSPIKVMPNLTTAFVRTITSRLTLNAVPVGDAYIDVQDFQSIFYWRQTVWTRLNQPDLANAKASVTVADNMLSEVLRLAVAFQDQGMFQQVQKLAPLFTLQRNVTDRSRFDLFTPINVVPNLHVVATNIQAGTLFDSFLI